ncbi:MAG: class I SAM-dependent methyltransferase [Bacteroidetes bacterium]|nr:class I SAM-dependent methyltransferase [Bacteroidota bacterium]
MNEFYRLKSFVEYQWKAKTKYYLHSPFVYQFYQQILEGEYPEQLEGLRTLRRSLSDSDEEIAVIDFGTKTSSLRKVADIERKVAVKEKYGLLLYRLASYFKPKTMLELGTSIGISSAYLKLARPDAMLVSLEGAPNLLTIASRNHSQLGVKNIEFIEGNFEETLPRFIEKTQQLDLVLFDGNHTQPATQSYFEQCLSRHHELSVFIFDDIHYSPEMNAAWESIKQHEDIRLTVDVFQFGICFFKKEKIAKEHFVLRY